MRTDHRRWAAMEADGAVGARLRREGAGGDEAEDGAEEGVAVEVEAEVETLVTGPARTRDREAGLPGGAHRGRPTVVHPRGHRHVVGEEETIQGREEVGEAAAVAEAAAGGAVPVTIHMIARARGAGARAAATIGDRRCTE